MPRLVIWLKKPLSRYYCDNEYLEGLNDMNTIIGMNIHSFIIESPGPGGGRYSVYSNGQHKR